MRIDLDKVPTRQEHMEPWEILLSESQERMLIVAQKGKENLLVEVLDKLVVAGVQVRHGQFSSSGFRVGLSRVGALADS